MAESSTSHRLAIFFLVLTAVLWSSSGLLIKTSNWQSLSILGGRSLVAEGDDEGGRVVIDLGDRKIEFIGDETGGHIDLDAGDDADADADAEDETETEAEAESDAESDTSGPG